MRRARSLSVLLRVHRRHYLLGEISEMDESGCKNKTFSKGPEVSGDRKRRRGGAGSGATCLLRAGRPSSVSGGCRRSPKGRCKAPASKAPQMPVSSVAGEGDSWDSQGEPAPRWGVETRLQRASWPSERDACALSQLFLPPPPFCV